jgi:hypothetical protein
VFGALDELPALVVIEDEDGVVVCMFEHHGFIVLNGVEKRQRLRRESRCVSVRGSLARSGGAEHIRGCG